MPTPEMAAYRRRVLGAATDPPVIMTPMTFDQAAKDLNDKMGGLLTQGDSWQSSNVTGAMSSAVQAYQAAGQAGATQVGPEIDAAGRPSVTQPYTQRAWTLNSALAAVNSTTTATEADAQLAEQYAKQMYSTYQTAIALGLSGRQSTGEVWKAGLVLGGVGLLSIWAYNFTKKSRKRGR